MTTRYYVDNTGAYLGGFSGIDPPENAIEVPTAPDDARCIWDGSQWVAPPPDPVEAEPVRIACALRIVVEDEAVMSVGGSFRVAGMVYLDTGTFLAVFNQSLGSVEPFVIPNNGLSITIAEWGNDYAVIEIRDHAGGSLITPPIFGFSLYQI